MNYLQHLRLHLISLQQTDIILIPESLETLKSTVLSTFLALPQQWDLIYINTDNQDITLLSEQDFNDLVADALRISSQTMIILIKERKNHPEPAQDLEFQVIDEKIEESLGSQPDIFQQIANLRRAFESSKKSQLSKDSVISAISQLVMSQNFNMNIHSAVRKPQQQEPKGKVPEGGPMANLIIGQSTLEEIVQKLINKNIHNIAAKTANILQNREDQPQNRPLHEDARCHECGISPIVGIKYKCLVCFGYELCETCESVHDHVHALMKIKRPDQQYQPQEKRGGYSKPVSLVQSDYIAVPVQHEEKPGEDEEEKSLSLQKPQIKKSVKIDLEPEVLLEVIQEESRTENTQVLEEEEKIDLGAEEEEKEEEKPEEIQRDNLLVSQEVKSVYSENVIEKAKQLKELLSEASLEDLFEFVNNSASDVDIVELMERFQKLTVSQIKNV